MNKDLAVLVSSCDKYSDLWRPFFTLFFKYWPDCPYKIYLESNSKIYDDSRVTTLPVGDNKTWSKDLRQTLKLISEDYIMYIMDDFLFCRSPIDIEKYFQEMLNRDAVYMRLYPTPEATIPATTNSGLSAGEILRGASWRTSCQTSIWKAEYLYSLLRNEESAFNFEIFGSGRSDDTDALFLAAPNIGPKPNIQGIQAWGPICHIFSAINGGKWNPLAGDFCRKEGIDIQESLNLRGSVEPYRRVPNVQR